METLTQTQTHSFFFMINFESVQNIYCFCNLTVGKKLLTERVVCLCRPVRRWKTRSKPHTDIHIYTHTDTYINTPAHLSIVVRALKLQLLSLTITITTKYIIPNLIPTLKLKPRIGQNVFKIMVLN